MPGLAEACTWVWSWVGTRGKTNAGVWRIGNKFGESGRVLVEEEPTTGGRDPPLSPENNGK